MGVDRFEVLPRLPAVAPLPPASHTRAEIEANLESCEVDGVAAMGTPSPGLR